MKPVTVSDYIAAQPPRVRKTLRRVRALIRKAIPRAEESISYRIPTYKLNGKAVIYFAGFAGHYSVVPAVGAAFETMRAQLEPYHVSKGTLRFSLQDPVPARLIERFAKLRAKESPLRTARRRA